MRLSEFQEQWRVIREELEESGRLVKRKEKQEDSTQAPQNTAETKATKDKIDIGVIFSQGRKRGR